MLLSYPWYFQGWFGSTARAEMTLAERGLYREVLDLCYQDGSVTSDPSLLRRHVHADKEEFELAWPAVKERLESREDGRLTHRKVREKLAELIRLKEVRSQSGLKAVRARWDKTKRANNSTNTPRIPQEVRHEYLASASASASTTTTTTTSPRPPDDRIEDICNNSAIRHPRNRSASPDLIAQWLISNGAKDLADFEQWDAWHRNYCDTTEEKFAADITKLISAGAWRLPAAAPPPKPKVKYGPSYSMEEE